MAGLVKLVAALASSFALLWAGIGAEAWWVRRPHGFPSVTVPLLLWKLKLAAPDSLKAQLLQAQAERDAAVKQQRVLAAALDGQNAAIQKLARDGQERDRRSAQAVAQAEASTASLRKSAARVMAIKLPPPPTTDAEELDQCRKADQLILENVAPTDADGLRLFPRGRP